MMLLWVAGVLVGGLNIEPYDPKTQNATVTDCDRLAAYTPDQDRIAPGVARDQMEVPRALQACQAAIAAQPRNPRLHYQLARVQVYAGDTAAANASRMVAAGLGYPSAVFVIGYQMALPDANKSNDYKSDLKSSAKDRRATAQRCNGVEIMRYSARAGAFAGQVALAAGFIDGSLAACERAADRSEIPQFLERAARSAQNFYEQLLVQSLRRELTTWRAPAAQRRQS